MDVRPEVRNAIDRLLAESREGGAVTIDELAAALVGFAASHEEVDHVMSALERAGREVTSPPPAPGPHGDGGAHARLRAVLVAARALTAELRRRPTVDEIAQRASLTPDAVRAALLLARVMGR